MGINRPASASLIILAAILSVGGCVEPSAPPARPAPRPVPAPAPAPSLSATRPAPAGTDWRDAAQTAGGWSYRTAANGSAAVFSDPAGAPLVWLRCDARARVVTLARVGQADGPLPMTVNATSLSRTLAAAPDRGDPPALMARMSAVDALLDAMAFSRGRFRVEVPGAAVLVLPAWAEVGRVVEDCR